MNDSDAAPVEMVASISRDEALRISAMGGTTKGNFTRRNAARTIRALERSSTLLKNKLGGELVKLSKLVLNTAAALALGGLIASGASAEKCCASTCTQI